MQSESSTQIQDATVPVEAPAHTLQLPVLGVPVSYESETPEALDVVAAALGAWRSLDRTPWLVETRGVHVGIEVDDAVEAAWAGDAMDRATTDGVRRGIRSRVPRRLLQDPRQFRHGPVEAATFAALEPLDRAPVNAVAVARRDGTALLLVGPSGAGKSSLAYAASGAGLKVLADGRVYVQTRPELRVWGLPGWLHLATDAATHFPELAGIRPVRLSNGTSRLALDVQRLGALPDLPLARRVGVCLVQRDESTESAHARVHPQRVTTELAQTSTGNEAYPDAMIALIERLAERGAWVLNASGSPSGLVPRLEAMLEAIVAQPAAAQQVNPG